MPCSSSTFSRCLLPISCFWFRLPSEKISCSPLHPSHQFLEIPPARAFPCKKGTPGGAKPSTRRKPHQGKALSNTNGPGLAQQHKTSSNLQQALLHPGWRKKLAPTHGTPGSGSWRRHSPLFRKGFLAPFVQKSLKMGLKLEAWIWLSLSPFLFQFVLWFVLPWETLPVPQQKGENHPGRIRTHIPHPQWCSGGKHVWDIPWCQCSNAF